MDVPRIPDRWTVSMVSTAFQWHNNAVEMARPKNKHKSYEVPITAPPKLVAYLQALVDLEEGYGNTKAEVARTLCWRMIEELKSRGVLQEIRGPIGDEEEPPETAAAG